MYTYASDSALLKHRCTLMCAYRRRKGFKSGGAQQSCELIRREFIFLLLLGFTYMNVLFLTMFLSYGILSLSNFISQLVSLLYVLFLFLSWLFLLLNFTLSLRLFSSPILILRSVLHHLDGFIWFLSWLWNFI